jgi:hypothetical protein
VIPESLRDTASEHSGNNMYHFLYVPKLNFATNCIYVFHMILIVNSEYFSEED